MQPRELSEADFRTYPPLARKFACDHLELLRDLPVVLAAILLRELIGFDTRFPQERATIETQLAFLGALTADERHRFTEGFAKLSLPGSLTAQNWVQFPQKFSEDLSAHLWSSGQIDLFHMVGTQFAEAIRKATPTGKPAIPRWTVIVLGPELRNDGYPLFRKLRPHGVFFSHVEDGRNGRDPRQACSARHGHADSLWPLVHRRRQPSCNRIRRGQQIQLVRVVSRTPRITA